MNIEKIFRNNRQWINSKLQTDQAYFKKLSKGQKPQILYIGCSDSRVTAEELMGAQPGDVFVLRNIANLVPNTDISAMSVINFAVTRLKVNHIAVCGHYYCTGVKSAMQSSDLGILNPWLHNIRDVYRLHKNQLEKISDEEARYKRLVELNVQEQCINVLKIPEVRQAASERNLSIHGWVFDIHSGELIDLKIDFNKILQSTRQIYNLQ
jgi:carbonic anhydrase